MPDYDDIVWKSMVRELNMVLTESKLFQYRGQTPWQLKHELNKGIKEVQVLETTFQAKLSVNALQITEAIEKQNANIFDILESLDKTTLNDVIMTRKKQIEYIFCFQNCSKHVVELSIHVVSCSCIVTIRSEQIVHKNR